ncbi:MAG: hypothetical protein ACYSWQ_29020 [Planctomycetota bacterium]
MRSRDMIICSVCVALAIGLCIGAGMQLDSINRQRTEMDLVMDTPENIPPQMLWATVATGAFRGLVVDVLWMRADRLKEEGQFFDARQLAEWITLLQPRFASVWEFHAWNMAYNISVAIPATEPEQRWRWVRNGYELIRDEAIGKYNLKSITAFRTTCTNTTSFNLRWLWSRCLSLRTTNSIRVITDISRRLPKPRPPWTRSAATRTWPG